MFENPRRGRQASKKFYSKCSGNSRSQVVFRTDIFRKFTLGAPDLRLGWISQTKTVITNGKFLASLPRRLITLQLPKQIVLTLCFNQALSFLPKWSAKYAIVVVPKQLVPERIRIAQPLSNLACALEHPSSLFIGDFKLGLLKDLLRWPEIILLPPVMTRQCLKSASFTTSAQVVKTPFIAINPVRLLCQMLANFPEVKVV